MNDSASLRSLLRTAVSSAPLLCVSALLLLVAGSVFEGIGILLLIPMLQIIGIGSLTEATDTEASASIEGRISEFFDRFGIDLTLETVLLVFLCALLIRTALNLMRSIVSTRLTTHFRHALRMRAYRALSGARWRFLAEQKTSALIHLVTQQINGISAGAEYVVRLASAMFSVATGIFIASLIDLRITALVLAIGIVLILPMILFNRRAYRLSGRAFGRTEALFAQMTRHFTGLKTARILSAEKQLESEFGKASLEEIRFNRLGSLNTAQATLFFEFGGAFFLVALVYVGVAYFSDSGLQVIMLIIIFSRLAPRVQSALAYWRALLEILPDHQAYTGLVFAAEAESETGDANGARLPLSKCLVLDNISFQYDRSRSVPPLDRICLSIEAGSSVAVVGRSGSGKSTLADLLTGLIEPTEGRILIDGMEISATNRSEWRDSTAYVLQEEYLFDGTILENMRIAMPKVAEPAIWSALETARIAQFVRQLPEGLQSEVGQNGVQLSRGQRQRLCLARALLARPALLVLDEATNAVNPVDEKAINTALASVRGNTTLVVIAHRLSSVNWVDRLIVLDRGNVVEDDAYEELVNRPGSFVHAMREAESHQIYFDDPDTD